MYWFRRSFAFFLFGSLCFSALAQSNPFESAIRAFEQADQRNPPPTNAILFVGSSSIVGWSTLAEAFPAFDVLNRGFGGSQASDVLHFYDRIVKRYAPPLIVFYEGDNDLASGRSVDQVFSDWTNLVARVERDLPQTHLLFIAVKPSPSRQAFLQRQRELNDRVREFNSRNPKLHFADVFHALLDSSGKPRTDVVVSDQLHLNAAGYSIWESVIVPEVEAWAATYPIEVRRPARNGLLIDLGSADSLSGTEGNGMIHWNNVTTTVGSSSSAALSNLVAVNGQSSPLTLTMISRFNGANENGTPASELYPTSATRDSLFGNTEIFSGLANITPTFQISGLDPSRSYRLSFYASRMGVNDNRGTRYTATGADIHSADLNAANNVDTTAIIPWVQPDSSGKVVLSLAPGPNNNNANHFTYLGVLQVEALAPPLTTWLLDFGSSGAPTTTESGESKAVWNNLLPEVATDDQGRLDALLATNGAGTGIVLSMLSRFNAVNENGTTTSTNFPASATQDSLYGNTELFNGFSNVTPRFKLSGLQPNGSYRFTFFASRLQVSDNRETRYTVTGRTSASVTLDAANNLDTVAVIEAIRPDENNEIMVELEPGPSNNNPNHFTYLGVLEVDWTIPPSAPATLLQARLEGNALAFLARGEIGSAYRLEASSDLETWSTVSEFQLTESSRALQSGLTTSSGMFFRLARVP